MRIWERLVYLLGVALAFTYGFELFVWSFLVVCMITVTTFLGAMLEGIRFSQWVYLVAFIPHIVLIIMDVYSIIALIIYCCFLSFAIISSFIFGEANFNLLKLIGPYQVGHKEFFSNEGFGITVFYPMDKEEYEKEIGSKNTLWFRHGFKSRLGLTRATADWGKENHPSPWCFKYLDDVKMDTVNNGKLAERFAGENADKIIPLVFLHGLTGSRTT